MSKSYQLRVIFLSLLLFACGRDSTGPAASPEGTYALTKVNGSALPTLWFQGSNGRVDIISGSMILRSDFSYQQTNEFRTTLNDGSQTSDEWAEIGTYNVSGRRITFTIDAPDGSNPPPYSGSIDPGLVAYTFDGVSYRFEK